jgi:hypothetical protein
MVLLLLKLKRMMEKGKSIFLYLPALTTTSVEQNEILLNYHHHNHLPQPLSPFATELKVSALYSMKMGMDECKCIRTK